VEVGVDAEALVGLVARQGVLGEVAHKRFLVEDCAEAAEEGPHAQLGNALTVFEGVAQVEDLAVVALVSVVTKVTAGTVETEVDVANDSGGIGWQFVEVGAGVPADAGDGHGGGHEHGGGEDEALHVDGLEEM